MNYLEFILGYDLLEEDLFSHKSQIVLEIILGFVVYHFVMPFMSN